MVKYVSLKNEDVLRDSIRDAESFYERTMDLTNVKEARASWLLSANILILTLIVTSLSSKLVSMNSIIAPFAAMIFLSSIVALVSVSGFKFRPMAHNIDFWQWADGIKDDKRLLKRLNEQNKRVWHIVEALELANSRLAKLVKMSLALMVLAPVSGLIGFVSHNLFISHGLLVYLFFLVVLAVAVVAGYRHLRRTFNLFFQPKFADLETVTKDSTVSQT